MIKCLICKEKDSSATVCPECLDNLVEEKTGCRWGQPVEKCLGIHPSCKRNEKYKPVF